MSGTHRPRKRMGQHFLHDAKIIDRILRTMKPRAGQRIAEIGPGLGALTGPLLEKAGALDVVELDRDLIPKLEENFAHTGELRIHQGNALTFDFSHLGPELRIVGNLPYNISTPLLFHLLGHGAAITDMHLMLQREVAERMAAGANTAAYGRLSATLAARARVELLFRAGRGAFHPPPRVESAVVRLIPTPPPFPLVDLATYDRLVTCAFGQRRKTLSNSMRAAASADQLRRADIDPRARAENIPPEGFGRLSLVVAGESHAPD